MSPGRGIAVRAAALVAALVCAAPAQTNLGTGTGPKVAYNASIDRYLVTWWVSFGQPTDTYGRFVLPNGSAQGSQFTIFSFGGFHLFLNQRSPRVAPVNNGNVKFVVVGIGGMYTGDILLVAVDTHGRSSTPFAVVGYPAFASSVDIGGGSTALDDTAIMVWSSGSMVEAVQVDPAQLSVVRQTRLSGPGRANEVAISPTGGQPGRYLVTWKKNTGAAADIVGAIIDRNVGILVGEFPIARTGASESNADVDGNGTDWLVAYQRRTVADSDIECRRVSYDPRSGTAAVSAPVLVQGQVGVNETDPAVLFTGESYQIGYAVNRGQSSDIVVESVESFACQPCEGTLPVASTTPRAARLGMAAGPGFDNGLLVWEAPQNLIQSTAVTIDDGEVVDLGGGCGNGGAATATCAEIGAPAFGIGVQLAKRSASGWLLLGTSQANFACGPCTLVPVPVAALPAVLDERGDAEVTFSLPNNPSLQGQSLLAQWLIVAPGGCAAPGWSFSNAIQVTIE